jgi:predicted nucleic acid-binding protein
MAIYDKAILIDADVVSHFVTAGKARILKQIFPHNPILILDKVHAELQQWPSPTLLSEVSYLLSKKIIRLIDFPDDNPAIVKEYAWIKTMLFKGDGESACLAVARYDNKILASSNLRDIKKYCTDHSISYLTTMDFLCEALNKNVLIESECDAFIQLVKAAGSRLPVNKMSEYTCRLIDFL